MDAERIIPEKDLRQYDTLSRTTRREMIKRGEYPAPVRLSEYRIGWRMSEVQAFIESRPRYTGNTEASPAA